MPLIPPAYSQNCLPLLTCRIMLRSREPVRRVSRLPRKRFGPLTLRQTGASACDEHGWREVVTVAIVE